MISKLTGVSGVNADKSRGPLAKIAPVSSIKAPFLIKNHFMPSAVFDPNSEPSAQSSSKYILVISPSAVPVHVTVDIASSDPESLCGVYENVITFSISVTASQTPLATSCSPTVAFQEIAWFDVESII